MPVEFVRLSGMKSECVTRSGFLLNQQALTASGFNSFNPGKSDQRTEAAERRQVKASEFSPRNRARSSAQAAERRQVESLGATIQVTDDLWVAICRRSEAMTNFAREAPNIRRDSRPWLAPKRLERSLAYAFRVSFWINGSFGNAANKKRVRGRTEFVLPARVLIQAAVFRKAMPFELCIRFLFTTFGKASGFTSAVAQVKQFRAANTSVSFDVDFGNLW